MWKYIVKRILALIPVLLAIILLIFAIMEFTPGDEATMALGGMASEEAKQEWRDEQGLDKPFLVRKNKKEWYNEKETNSRYYIDMCNRGNRNSYCVIF